MTKDHINEIDPMDPITQQGSHWWILLNEGDPTAAEKKAFSEWVGRGPERIEAFLRAARLIEALKSPNLRWPDIPVEILVREAKEAPAGIVPLFFPNKLQSKAKIRSHPRRPRSMFAMAVAILLLAVAVVWTLRTVPQRYATVIGEQRSIVLSDGSVVALNTSSIIKVKFTKSARTIQLLAGEALFQVAHDQTRPFNVIAGSTTVRAVGTRFNVDLRASDTTVTVVEGKVSIESGLENAAEKYPNTAIPLLAGEVITVSARVKPRPTTANVAAATAWTQRRLIFEHRPLGEAAAEFNRYNRHEIQIKNAELRNQQVTGVFQANDPNSFLDFIAKIPGVRIEQQGDATKVVTSD